MRLHELREFVVQALPAEIITHDGWLHGEQFRAFCVRQFQVPISMRERVRVLRLGQELLRHFASGQCKLGKPKWSNPNYCSPSPYGSYGWEFHCGMVDAILGCRASFRRGVRFGRNPSEPYRDANPYKDTRKRCEWDYGYILGLKWDDVVAWVGERQP